MSKKIPSLSHSPPHLVVTLAYDQLCTFEFACAVEVFALDRPELQVDWYRFLVCAAESGPLRAMGGVQMQAPYSLRMLDQADTIIIPGWRDVNEVPPQALLKKLRAAHQRGARIASICSGVFVLAAAGLLEGKTVTTHWRYSEQLAQQFPNVRIDTQALYIDQGQIITSAGSAAGLDMMLHIVRNDFGVKVANQVAQRLVIPPHREGGQAQFVPRPVADNEQSRLSQLLDFLRQHPAQLHTIESMAARVAMSVRSLQRQFVEVTGYAPYEWLLRERIALVKELLESSDASLSQLMELSGFTSEESLRRHFRRLVGTSPIAYRKRFSDPI
jgi:AraC family transcriptional activator FtrA